MKRQTMTAINSWRMLRCMAIAFSGMSMPILGHLTKILNGHSNTVSTSMAYDILTLSASHTAAVALGARKASLCEFVGVSQFGMGKGMGRRNAVP